MNFIFLLLFCLLTPVQAVQLKVGDILLQPLNCWSCDLIEEEENTIFSHMGMVISESPLMVSEALGTVRRLPLSSYVSRTEKGQKISVLRLKNSSLRLQLESLAPELERIFASEYEGKKYDKEFLWSNVDEEGQEKYYCSEFVSKILFQILGVRTPLKRMHFLKNRERWMTWFNGRIPDDEWGNSPGDFERSELFEKVGDL